MLPDIDGIHMDEALARLGGNGRIYARLLLNFANQCEATLAAFHSGNPGHVRFLAHKLKGVAANLGVWGVHQAALCLEHDDPDTATALEDVSRNLREVCGRIHEQLATWSEANSQPPYAEWDMARLWEKLQSDLQSFDADVLDTWSQFKGRLRGTIAATELESLDKMVQAFEFPSTLKRLRELQRQNRFECSEKF